jgi:integrase
MIHPDLIQDIDQYLSRRVATDPFDLTAPMRGLKESSVNCYKDRLRRFAGCLILAGTEPSQLRSLADLVELEAVHRGLRYLAYERGAKSQASDIGRLLSAVARDLCCPNESVQAISQIASRLRANRKGLVGTVRERLLPLRHEANLARLFVLPMVLARALIRNPQPSAADARKFQVVLALALLTVCPLRIGSLCSIRIERHLNWSGGPMKGQLVVEFAPGELKNDEPASFPIPSDVSSLVRVYCERFRPLIAPGGSPFLFCGPFPNQPRTKGGLGRQIGRLIFDRIGLRVNPHLFRHIVHLVVLRQFPGAYAMVARVLTHRSISTTVENYSYLDGEIAMRAYQRLVENLTVGTTQDFSNLEPVAYGIDHGGLYRGGQKP